MIPDGFCFNDFRQSALAAYPNGISVPINHYLSIQDWFSKGSYTSTISSANRFSLIVTHKEIAESFMADIELLFNHCAEQIIELYLFFKDKDIRSSAWSVVTIYYFAFFSGQILLRLLGKPVVYIDPTVSSFINGISRSTFKISPGSYKVDAITPLSATNVKLDFLLLKGKAHQVIWKEIFNILQSTAKLSKTTDETLFYNCLCSRCMDSIYKNNDWPSKIRNLANYRPGYAYSLVLNKDICKSKRLLERWTQSDNCSAVKLLNETIMKCNGNGGRIFNNGVNLLHDIGISIYLLNIKLYRELVIRRNLDKRWENARNKLIEKVMGEVYKELLNNYVYGKRK